MRKYIYSRVVNLYIEKALMMISQQGIASYKLVDGRFFLTINPDLDFQQYLTKVFTLSNQVSLNSKTAESHEAKEVNKAILNLLNIMQGFIIVNVEDFEKQNVLDFADEDLAVLTDIFEKYNSYIEKKDGYIYCNVDQLMIASIAADVMFSSSEVAKAFWVCYTDLNQNVKSEIYRKVVL